MDNRLILAIALSALVIFGFQLYVAKTQKHLAPKGIEKTNIQAQRPSSKSSSSKELNTSFVLQNTPVAENNLFPSYKVREVSVDTSLFHALLTEAGGRFKNFTLKDYHKTVDPKSPLIDLVAAPKLGLPVEVYPTKEPDLGVAPLKASALELKLAQKNREGRVLFEPLVQKPLKIKKVFTFQNGSYLLDLKVAVENTSDKPWTDRLLFRLVGAPISKKTRYVFSGPAYSHQGTFEEVKLKKPGQLTEYNGEIDWAGYNDLYFLLAMVPPSNGAWRATFRKLNERDQEIILWSPKFTLPPNSAKEFDLKLYMGPKSLETLKKAGYNLKSALHFGFFDPLAKPLLYCLHFIYRYTHNYGIAIIVLTFVIRLLFWPLNHMSYKSMKKMQELQPRIQKLKEKFGDDKTRLNQELMQLYRTYNVNPFMGCLPMLIQIPVFFALYKVLLMAIELRHAPFFAWINDLSAPDRLYIGVHIPYLGGIPVLTILMGVSMYFQQKLSPTSMDPTQAQIMLLMPVVFTLLFINFPSGLVLYWLTNNILSIIQQLMTMKMVARSKTL